MSEIEEQSQDPVVIATVPHDPSGTVPDPTHAVLRESIAAHQQRIMSLQVEIGSLAEQIDRIEAEARAKLDQLRIAKSRKLLDLAEERARLDAESIILHRLKE